MALKYERCLGDCNHQFYRYKSQVKMCHYCGETIVDGDEASTWKKEQTKQQE